MLWQSKGMVTMITESEEIVLELKEKKVPKHLTENYTIEFVWHSTSYNRMKTGLKRFVDDEKSISNYLYKSILGHKMQPKEFDIDYPKVFSVPKLPELNIYQIQAVKKALKTPL